MEFTNHLLYEYINCIITNDASWSSGAMQWSWFCLRIIFFTVYTLLLCSRRRRLFTFRGCGILSNTAALTLGFPPPFGDLHGLVGDVINLTRTLRSRTQNSLYCWWLLFTDSLQIKSLSVQRTLWSIYSCLVRNTREHTLLLSTVCLLNISPGTWSSFTLS